MPAGVAAIVTNYIQGWFKEFNSRGDAPVSPPRNNPQDSITKKILLSKENDGSKLTSLVQRDVPLCLDG